MHAQLSSYLAVSTALLAIGLTGLLLRRNLVAVLISLELVLNSAALNFVAFNRFCLADKTAGQVMTVFIIALAAAEVTIGLSLILWLHRSAGSINVERADRLKG